MWLLPFREVRSLDSCLIAGMDLVDNRTAYSLDAKTLRFKQTEYMSNMLSRTKKACGNLLQRVRALYAVLIVANDK